MEEHGSDLFGSRAWLLTVLPELLQPTGTHPELTSLTLVDAAYARSETINECPKSLAVQLV